MNPRRHLLKVVRSPGEDSMVRVKIGERFELTNSLAASLTGEYMDVLPAILSALLPAYSPGNTYGDFVLDVPNKDLIMDQLKSDALAYIAYRYGLAAMGDVHPDSVKNPFKHNSVLAAFLSGQTPGGSAAGLSVVLSRYFPQVAALARSSGKEASLTGALKRVLGSINMDLAPVALLPLKELLRSRQVHLGEHHIYGSSRLGMQQYLPEALRYEYQPDQGSLVYQSLFQRKPWYSLYGHDLFDTLVFHNDLRIATMGTGGMGIQSHMLGKRHYELSNHLGNVQATVLDRTTPVIADPDGGPVRGYHADMATAVDYYPFGMPMPGRYVSDTARHCITVNQTVLVPRPVTVSVAANPAVAYRYGGDPVPSVGTLPPAAGFGAEKLYVYHYSSLDEHPEGWVVQTSAMEGGKAAYQVDLSGEPSGISAYLLLHMDTSQSEQVFGFSMELPDEGSCQVSMRVRQYSDPGGTEYYGLTDWMEVHSSGYRDLVVAVDKQSVKAGGLTVLEWQFSSYGGLSFAHGVQVGILGPETIATVPVAENRVVTICDEKDNYRFGWNTHEKVNEIAGVGNHTTALFGEFDTRTGRRWNRDPKPQIGISDYAVNSNNPIWASDPLGDFDTRREARQYKRAQGISGKITKGNDGLFSIDDKKNSLSYTRDKTLSGEPNVLGVQPDGVLRTTMATAKGSNSSGNCYTCWLYDEKNSEPFKRAYELGYTPYRPDAIGISIPVTINGMTGYSGSLNIGFVGNDFGVWYNGGINVGTPEMSIALGFFMAEYRGKGAPTLDNYMGYGSSHNSGFLMFSGSYSKGYENYRDKNAVWHTYQGGIGLSSRELVPGLNATYNYSPINYSAPLIKLSFSNGN